MKREETTETTIQTIFKVAKSALLGFIVLIGVLGLAFATFLYTNGLPDITIDLASVARDTTFYVGASQSQSGEGSTISVRAVGQVDDATTGLLVTYPNDTLVAVRGSLVKGQIDQLWVNDFYDRRAKVTFLHKAAQHGHLRLQIHFSYPPTDWGFRQTNLGWIKAK
ncbi:hypothetical protein [Spirosoma jeollabukense]